MKLMSLRPTFGLAVFCASAVLAQAHPGHDDGHELTWDLGHLAAHPLATLAGLTVLVAAGWAGFQVVRRATAWRTQSLRGSQPSRE